MKLIKKITFIIIFIFVNVNAFGAVSRVVDSFQVTQRIPTGVVFNPDGTKMFISGMSQNRVMEFDLTTGFDVSEATINSNECDHADKDGNVVDLRLNSNGTKLFIVGYDNKIILEYSLSTAYDVSTCSYENTFFSGDGLNPRSMAFNTNGTKLFIYDQTGDYSVKQYSLNSAYDLTNATLVKEYTGTASKTLKDIEKFAQGMAFSADGTKMYLTGDFEDKVHEFNLSTPFDLSNVTKKGGYDVSDDGVEQVSGIAFSSDGLKMFVLDFKTGNKTVSEYNLTCGFGVINCIDPTANKDDVASIETQSEASKKLIQHTTYPVLNRMEWLRRNSGRTNLTNQNIKFQISNEILSALSESLIPIYFSNENSEELNLKNKNWSFWSEGTINIGKIGDTLSASSKSINTTAITIGADKRDENNIMRGFAIRMGADDVDIGNLGSAMDMSAMSLTFYESKPKGSNKFVDSLVGISLLESDLVNNSGTISTKGKRNGAQLFGSVNFRDTYSKDNINFTPKFKISAGATHYTSYSETGAEGLDLNFKGQNIANLIATTGTSLDNTYELSNGTFIPYFDIEYYADISPSSSQKFSYASDGSVYSLKYNNNSVHNFRSGVGFDFATEYGLNLMSKYTRDQSQNGMQNDSFIVALDYRISQRSSYAMSIQDTSTKLSHKSELNGLYFDLDSKYDFFSEQPQYGIYLKVSNRP